MKRFFRLTHYVRGFLHLNPRVLFAVSLTFAAPFSGSGFIGSPETTPSITIPEQTTQSNASLPVIQYKTQPKRSFVGTVFSYTSTIGQTDATPTITASGLNVIDGTLATNCLPFGTKVHFPTLYGNKEFTVTDRMAPHHNCNSFDIWQESLTEAKQFGRQVALVEVY